MAGKISDLTSNPAVDRTTDLLEIVHSGASYKITPNAMMGFTGGAPVSTSDTQSLTNKTLDNTNTITLKATLFTLQDSSDTTKQARFSLASVTTGTTRTYTLPDVTDTVVTLTATQTLTNKTLTSPTINTPTITNATINADALTGFSVSNTGTIYGVSVTTGVITSASVGTSALVAAAVTAAKMQYGMVRQRQGGTTGDASWLTNGTSSTDTSAKGVFIQVGNAAATAQTTSISFPVAFTQIPLVIATPSGGAGLFSAGWYVVTQTTTSFSFVAADYTKVTGISWIAIGQ